MSDSFNKKTNGLWHIENCLDTEEEFTVSDETEGTGSAVLLHTAEILGGSSRVCVR